MTRQAVSSDQAPAALGPYSQAIVAGGLVFCSGMAGIDPSTGKIPEGIEAQTEQALVNLAAVLAAAGASMADVAKTTIFYADVEDFGRLNEVYARHMPDPPPARSAPADVRLPRGLLVSIEAIVDPEALGLPAGRRPPKMDDDCPGPPAREEPSHERSTTTHAMSKFRRPLTGQEDVADAGRRRTLYKEIAVPQAEPLTRPGLHLASSRLSSPHRCPARPVR
jgi:2-iminobutanoate/2-iminopropanoate deaminase